MKRFLVLLAALTAFLPWAVAQAAFAIVGSPVTETTDDFGDGTMSITVPATTIGNLVVVVTQFERGGRTVSSISGGGTYTLIGGGNTGSQPNGGVYIHAAIATSSVTTVTVTANDTTDFGQDRLTVIEFSGPASPLDEAGTDVFINHNTGTTTHDAGTSITPTNSESLYIGALVLGGSAGGVTTNSFTQAFVPDLHYVGYKIVTGSTSAQSFTATTGSSRTGNTAFIGIEGAVGGASGLLLRRRRN